MDKNEFVEKLESKKAEVWKEMNDLDAEGLTQTNHFKALGGMIGAFDWMIRLAKNVSLNLDVSSSRCDDWIHNERIKMNDDKYCPICGTKLQAN